MPIVVGTTVASRYDILQQIGAGGMGEVYRARDRQLDELVALKVISADATARPELIERFRREVKLARRVTHRNVARMFEFGHAADVLFCTMELIDGEPLSHMLHTGRGIPLGDAATIVSALCDALEAAHAVGVIHRDLKPDNVLIAADGRVVLTDFGLAALRHGEGDLFGTPLYVAPEQARGEPPTPLADVYSLGIMLFELVTGRHADRYGSLAAVEPAAETDTSTTAAQSLDPVLEELIRKATAEEPARRLPSVRALRERLAAWARAPQSTGATGIRRVVGASDLATIVVHPPRIGSDAPAHLAEAFHHELLEILARQPGVRVILRPIDVDHAGATAVDLFAGATEIEVTAPAGGGGQMSVRLPLSADRLIDTTATAARAIAGLVSDSTGRRPTRPPLPADALDLYEQGRHLARDRLSLARAAELFVRADRLAPGDPRIAAAHAMCDVRLAFFADDPQPALLTDAASRAHAALVAAPDLAEAHMVCGHVALHDGEAATAVGHYRAAIARTPFLIDAHAWLGTLLLEAGHVSEGIARCEHALAMTPTLAAPRWELIRMHALERQWAEVDRGLAAISTSHASDRLALRVRLAAWRGARAELVDLRDQLARRTEAFERMAVHALAEVALAGHWHGRREQFAAWMNHGGAGARRQSFLAQMFAEASGWASEIDDCFAGLAVADRCGLFDLYWLDRCPSLAIARDDARFEAVRASVKARADAVQDALYGDRSAADGDAPTIAITAV